MYWINYQALYIRSDIFTYPAKDSANIRPDRLSGAPLVLSIMGINILKIINIWSFWNTITSHTKWYPSHEYKLRHQLLMNKSVCIRTITINFNFSNVELFVLFKLFYRSYCCYFYGSNMWNLNSIGFNKIYTSRNIATRNILSWDMIPMHCCWAHLWTNVT